MPQPTKIVSYQVMPQSPIEYTQEDDYTVSKITQDHIVALDDKGQLWTCIHCEAAPIWKCLNLPD